ncbi:family 2 encapsulin nanocompartment cargo protein polyprenyl transferase [Salinactinospora qingdaonensis]|uniref:Family 2 encapsulin nanocompartment cargo protein polyprenyl transferase n=1 Tax=Salinactinospora qingdaonensis TaxID=702744 RepID=A0ABP7FXG8_9ACTN
MAAIEEERAAESSVSQTLAWSRATVDPALRAAVDTLSGSTRRVIGYHFGWCDQHGHPIATPAGKAVRPALALLAATATGGTAAVATPAAAAVELVHNFSLLHDDVMDGDTNRRHRPTAWSVFGLGPAILAGDALLTLALDVLAASGNPTAQEGVRMVSAAVQDLVAGQSSDMAFEERRDVGVEECVSMARRKTAALLGCSCALGASFAGASPERVEHLRAFGDHLGLAFQFADDLLGIWGDSQTTGKPVHSDLRNRKKSLPVVAALASDTDAGRELAAFYTDERPLDEADVVRAAQLVDNAGGRAWAQSQADELLAQALQHLQAAEPAPEPAAELTALAHLAVRRDH